MSADLTWELVKNQSCFLVKRPGIQFTTEPNNLVNVNSYKYSGLANARTVGLTANPKGRGVVLTTARGFRANKIANRQRSVALTRGGPRHTAKSIVGQIATYRPDLRSAALGRATALLRAQKPVKVGPKRRTTGPRASRK
ncbi:MAG: ribosomal protein L28e [Piptocephalis tieghemiana]|nr:MAG: ribosomal protein L28e [Piptocephalis tieghemiana]